jgi:hypothetical protein
LRHIKYLFRLGRRICEKIAAETPERQQFMPLIEYLIKKVLKMLFPSQQIYIIFVAAKNCFWFLFPNFF